MLHNVIVDSDLYVCLLLNVNRKSISIFFQFISHDAQSIINDEIFVVNENEWIEKFLERKNDYIFFDDKYERIRVDCFSISFSLFNFQLTNNEYSIMQLIRLIVIILDQLIHLFHLLI